MKTLNEHEKYVVEKAFSRLTKNSVDKQLVHEPVNLKQIILLMLKASLLHVS